MPRPTGATLTLRPYQQKIIEESATALADGGDGQIHMACGSGKTIVAQQICMELLPAGGVVGWIVPSIALAAQALECWASLLGQSLSALVVCGDETSIDSAVRAHELLVPVTTDAREISAWLREHPTGIRLVLSTMKSAHRLAEAVRATGALDVVILDEAHHFTGVLDTPTKKILDRRFLPTARRIALTATPRYELDGQRDAGGVFVGMDNEDVFGPVLGCYSFAEGVREGYLRDWMLAIICVRDVDARAVLSQGAVTYVGAGSELPLREAAAQVALARAREQFGIGRVLTFHPRVRAAEHFAATLPETLAKIAPEQCRNLFAAHVDGSMSQRDRTTVRDSLARVRDGWAVVPSARCLSEGVDLPPIDAVLLTYAKESEVDITQVIGRAMRPAPKDSGPSVIILPHIVYGEDEEFDEVNAGELETILHVVAALRAHDEDFAAAIDTQLQYASTGESTLPEKLTIQLAPGLDERFLRTVALHIVQGDLGMSWLAGYDEAAVYFGEHGNLGAQFSYISPSGFPLGEWLKQQRKHGTKGRIGIRRRELLDAIGMDWTPQRSAWQRGYEHLVAHCATAGSADVPADYVAADGYRLGGWLLQQRIKHRDGRLREGEQELLEEQGVTWIQRKDSDARWNRNYAAAAAYRAHHGDLEVSSKYVTPDGVKLGAFIQYARSIRQGKSRGRLTSEQIAALDGLGMRWESFRAVGPAGVGGRVRQAGVAAREGDSAESGWKSRMPLFLPPQADMDLGALAEGWGNP